MNHNGTAIAFTDDKTSTLKIRGRDLETRANLKAMYGRCDESQVNEFRTHGDIHEAVAALRRGDPVILKREESRVLLLSPEYLNYVNSVLESVTEKKPDE